MITENNGVKMDTETELRTGDFVFYTGDGNVPNHENFTDSGYERYYSTNSPVEGCLYMIVDLMTVGEHTLAFIQNPNTSQVQLFLTTMESLKDVKIKYPKLKPHAPERKVVKAKVYAPETVQGQFARGICPTEIKDTWIPRIIDMLESYEYAYCTYEALKIILDTWAQEKGKLIATLMNHPDFDLDQLSIVCKQRIKREFDVLQIKDFVTWMERVMNDGTWHQPDEIPGTRYDNYYRIKCLLSGIDDSTVTENVLQVGRGYFPAVKGAVGQKVTRYMRKIFCYVGLDSVPKTTEINLVTGREQTYDPFERAFAKFSDALSPIELKEKLIFSVNPVDYLLMSNGHTWASCHTIDKHSTKQNNYSGCYSSGTVSYMLDGVTCVLYSMPDSVFENSEVWSLEDKITRQMFHIKDDTIIQGRLYPQGNDRGANDLYKQYRACVEDLYSTCVGVDNIWNTKTRCCDDIRGITISEGTHYRDYLSFDTCTLSVNSNIDIHVGGTNCMTIGHTPICVDCGEPHDYSEWITCCHRNIQVCGCCDEEINPDDACWSDAHDCYLCNDCAYYCHGNDEYYMSVDGTYAEDDEEWYSYNYLRYNGYQCDECGGWFVGSDSICQTRDCMTYCNDCFEEHAFTCDECGEDYSEDCHNTIEYEGQMLTVCDTCYNNIRAELEKGA